jgi:hypothetical protein
MRLLTGCLALLTAAGATAQGLDLYRPAANPDPLRAAVLPIEPAAAIMPAPGTWQVTASIGTFNLWDLSKEIAGVRSSERAGRTPVTSAELRTAEALYPGRPLWLLDVGGSRADLFVSRGLASALAVTLHVPWIDIGNPGGDGLAEWWHRVTGLPNGDRALFPRDAILVYLHGPDGTIERRDLGGTGMGDASLALTAACGRWGGAEHRAMIEIQGPTGRKDGLWGSGGWEVGARWFAAWRWPHSALLAGAGYTRLAGSGDLLGVRRSDAWSALAGVDLRVWRSLSAFYRVAVERSPLAGFSAGEPGEAALFMRFGLAAPTAAGWWAFEMGQNWPGIGTAPDYSIQLSFARRLVGKALSVR